MVSILQSYSSQSLCLMLRKFISTVVSSTSPIARVANARLTAPLQLCHRGRMKYNNHFDIKMMPCQVDAIHHQENAGFSG
jgi:hypothetical protein